MTSQLKWLGVVIAAMLVVGGAVWFFFLRTTTPTQTTQNPIGLGVGNDRTVIVPATGSTSDAQENQVIEGGTPSTQKIFKITDGPVAAATLVQTQNPTTTLARYVLQENGHVLDQILDSAGAVARAVSNTTIPGAIRGIWEEKGNAVVLQYLDSSTVKSVYLGFPSATSTATSSAGTRPVQIRFFPDNIEDIAASPDGKNAAYLLQTAAGADGYVAKSDGTGSKKLFSVPFSESLVSWPSANTQLVYTKSAASVTGIAFSVNTTNGAVVPLLSAAGLTVIADRTFTHLVYRVTTGDTGRTYTRETKTSKELGLSFDPIPEKCIWSTATTTTLYCATPLQYTPNNYLDLWHQGLASVADSIVSYDVVAGKSNILATPGSADGGIASDIAALAVSPDDKYLLFIKKSDRSLWGVRLGN